MPKLFFPEGMGGVQNSSGNSGAVGGLFYWSKKWKFRGGGGAYVKFPPWWGYGYFLELHIVIKTSDASCVITDSFDMLF